MIRVGKLTHRIYKEDYPVGKIGECCYMFSSEDEITIPENEDCQFCRGCPEYWYDEEENSK